MSKRPVSLFLKLTEHEGIVTLIVEDDGKTVVDFENTEAPAVRVNGFTKRSPDQQLILNLMEREGPSYRGGSSEVLDFYIHSLEKQVYNKTLYLRSEARKLAILGEALGTAKILRKSSREK